MFIKHSSSTGPISTQAAEDREGAATHASAIARERGATPYPPPHEAAGSRLRRRQLESGEPASAVGPLSQALTPVKPQAEGPAADLALARHRAVHRSARSSEVSIDDVERRALILVAPGLRRRDLDDLHLIAAFTVLDPGDRARPHRHTVRGDPLCHARRRRRHHRQRPALRHAGRRSDPHAADVLARPHQRERPPHHLVRRRQHSAHSPARRAISSSPAIPRPTSSGRSTRATRSCGPSPAWPAPTCEHAPAHSPKYRYSGEATRRLLAALPAGPDGAHTMRYTNPATGGAVMPALDCYAVRLPQRPDDPAEAHHLQHDLSRGVRRGPLDGRRAHVRVVAARRVHRSRTGPCQPHAPRWRRRACSCVSDRSAFERLDLLREECA